MEGNFTGKFINSKSALYSVLLYAKELLISYSN